MYFRLSIRTVKAVISCYSVSDLGGVSVDIETSLD